MGGSGGLFGGGGGVGLGVVRVDVNEELKFLGKLKKNGGVWGVGLGGGQDGCERRIFVKIQQTNKKKKMGGVRGGGGFRGGGGVGLGGQGGCERRIEVFVKIQKKNFFFLGGGVGGGGVGGVRVDVNEELKFLGKFTKIKIRGGGGR